MTFELIAVVLAGIAGAGGLLVLRKAVRALPRWTVPVAGGVAMLAAAISLEYSWFARTSAALPEDVVVAATRENRAIWRPWTFAVPYTDGFIAVDRASIRTNTAARGQMMAELYAFGRWLPVQRVGAVFDCDKRRRADLIPGLDMAADGTLPDAAWRDVGAGDPILRAVCRPPA